MHQFTQTDPLEAETGPPYPSAYVYGNNNPMVFTDPSGERGMNVGAGGEYLVPSNPVRDPEPERLALVMQNSGDKLPAKGCFPAIRWVFSLTVRVGSSDVGRF